MQSGSAGFVLLIELVKLLSQEVVGIWIVLGGRPATTIPTSVASLKPVIV